MSANTAKHAGLQMRVGNTTPGLRGDLVIWNPDKQFTVSYMLYNFMYLHIVVYTYT